MKTLIYYFTGTGNSLAVARGLCSRIGDCELAALAPLTKEPGPIVPDAARVGIVSPLYFSGLPAIVADFSRKLDLSRAAYVFSVITMGGTGGSAAIRQLDGLLKGAPGKRGLDAGFTVKMPGNYIVMYDSLDWERIEETIRAADRRVEEIAEKVKQGAREKPAWSPIAALLHHLAYPRFIGGVHEADREFTVDDRCTSCNTCVEICPVENIRLENGRPVWLHHCEQCMACIQLCPANAIQAGKKTEGRKRYHHPAVGIEALRRVAKK
jgi:NAD-dependent dihydropyrimidine dehydrogenase PreA subunit